MTTNTTFVTLLALFDTSMTSQVTRMMDRMQHFQLVLTWTQMAIFTSLMRNQVTRMMDLLQQYPLGRSAIRFTQMTNGKLINILPCCKERVPLTESKILRSWSISILVTTVQEELLATHMSPIPLLKSTMCSRAGMCPNLSKASGHTFITTEIHPKVLGSSLSVGQPLIRECLTIMMSLAVGIPFGWIAQVTLVHLQ